MRKIFVAESEIEHSGRTTKLTSSRGMVLFSKTSKKSAVSMYSRRNRLDTDEKRKEYTLEWQKPNPLHHYRIGYDPATGSSNNPTIVIRDMATNRIVRQFNMYGKNYDAQYSFIASWSAMYNHAPCAWLRTGHGYQRTASVERRSRDSA